MTAVVARAALILLVPLIVGVGLGYSIRPGESVSDEPSAADYEAAFPEAQAVPVQQDGEIAGSRQNAITRAVARVSPAVVGINVIEIREYRDPFFRFFGDDPWMRRFFGDRTYRQQVKGLGSGFVISPDGYIVTNDHVAGNATQITVTLTSGAKLEAKLIGTDPVTDIALLKVEGNNLPSLNLGNSDEIVIGEWAIAFGNPFGLFEINDKPTVTVGVISSTGMNLGRVDNRFYADMIETDAAINGGNSGGPLVNSVGDVIGMNTLIYTGGQSTTFVGYGFAIPINKVKRIVAELKRNGKVARESWHGFDFQSVDSRIARYFGLQTAEGVIVSEIERGGPADVSGLRVGDIVLDVNDEKIASEDDLYVLLSDARVGETLRMKVYRDKKTITVTLKLERRSQ
ncbi:MAG TPA: trypsin-like peptidase domain-containing protein [Bacteroidota bacterium]